MQMEEVAVSKCIEYYNVMNSLQTAKSMLQWIMQICGYVSLQLTANSFCSEACFYVKNKTKTNTIELPSIPVFIRVSAIFNPLKNPRQLTHCKLQLQFCSFTFSQSATAHCNHTYYPFRG